MALFVHLAPARDARSIRRAGLKGVTGWLPGGVEVCAVFLFPVLESYAVTHQWGREVTKWRRMPHVRVRVRLADETPVFAGRYNEEHAPMSAAEAIGLIRRLPDPLGWEVVLGRAVRPDEIVGVAPIAAGRLGWRHKPGAHGRIPCGCPGCVPAGQPGGRRLRERYERDEI